MSAASEATLAMLEYARPAAENGDFVGLRKMLDGVRVDVETKAKFLVETSYAESLAGRYCNARTAALLAYCLQPVEVETRRQLAARLRTTNDVALLRDLIKCSGPLDRLPIPLLLTYAAQLSYLNLQEAALPFLDEARRADPLYPPTLLSRGQVLTYLGRIDEAVSEFERCINIAPRIGQAHWFLAHVRTVTEATSHVARLRTLLSDPRLPVQDEISLAFALHKELDDLRDHEGAWRALERACKAKRRTLQYRSEDTDRLVDMLIGMPIGESVSPDGVSFSATPIFIVGMHRSGTTLLEQLLDGSPDVRGVGELYDFTSAMRYATDHHCHGVLDIRIVERASAVNFAHVGRRYLQGMDWRLNGARFFTDKLPSNFLNIGFICQALPNAKILHMVRDPMETCFSNLRELFSDANPYSYDQGELAQFHAAYRRLMAHWCARFPGRILDVHYSELTKNPSETMRRVAGFCGLEYVPAMSDPRSSQRAVATASAVQIRSGVVQRKQPKWAPYSQHLQPLIAALKSGG